MKVLGLVVEYNPFHKGHMHHIKSSIELVKPNYVIAIMSGNFVQRGEPSIIDKFTRTKIALDSGIDVVIELPLVYSIQDANGFAKGSIGLLERSNIITDLVFGSESYDLKSLKYISNILTDQPKKFKKLLKKYLKDGLSFPNARKNAVIEYFTNYVNNDFNINFNSIEKSNDILGLEYINNLNYYNSKITPNLIKRIGSEYNSEIYKGELSSASAIRRMIKNNQLNLIKNSLTINSYERLIEDIQLGKGPIFYEDLNDIIISRLKLIQDPRNILNYWGINEGIEKRIFKAAKNNYYLNDLIKEIKTKRFTFSRIKRTLLSILFNLDKKIIEEANLYGPQYLRVLGFNSNGKNLLSIMKKKCKIPIITTSSKYLNIYKYIKNNTIKSNKRYISDPAIFLNHIEKDFIASDIYTILYKNKNYSLNRPDFINKVIIHKE